VITYPHSPPRFSVGWYSGRFYGFVSASIVLFVLLYETTTLYALLFRALVAERRERNARLMTWDAVSASIAHEIRQPLAAVIMSAQAGLRWLRRAQPDIGEAEEAFDSIARDGRRAELERPERSTEKMRARGSQSTSTKSSWLPWLSCVRNWRCTGYRYIWISAKAFRG
jgi:signal transduction histidine kinase